MIRDIKLEDLPSYQIVMERGFSKGVSQGLSQGLSQGISQGITQGIIDTATMMIKEFNLSVEAVAKKLNISIDEIKRHLK